MYFKLNSFSLFFFSAVWKLYIFFPLFVVLLLPLLKVAASAAQWERIVDSKSHKLWAHIVRSLCRHLIVTPNSARRILNGMLFFSSFSTLHQPAWGTETKYKYFFYLFIWNSKHYNDHYMMLFLFLYFFYDYCCDQFWFRRVIVDRCWLCYRLAVR